MAIKTMVLAAVVLGLLVASSLAAEEPNAKLLVTRAARKVDLSSQLVKQTAEVTLQNEGESSVGHFLYVVDGTLAPRMAYISAQVRHWLLSVGKQCITHLFVLTSCPFIFRVCPYIPVHVSRSRGRMPSFR